MKVARLALPRSLRSGGREPPRAQPLGYDVVVLILVGLAYFTLAYLGLRLALINPSATPIWPPTGLAIAAILLLGNRTAPAIFISAFLINQLTAGSIFTSLAIACGNTLEAMIAGYLVRHWAEGEQVFDTPTGVAKFTLIGLAATLVSATIGVSSLTLAGYAELSRFFSVWFTWWLGDLAGALVVTPVVVLWARCASVSLALSEMKRTGLLYLVTVAVGVMAFSPVGQQIPVRDALAFLVILPLLWASLHEGPRETATVALIISAFAVWGTLMHSGPFARPSLTDSFTTLLAFMVSAASFSLALSTDLRVKQRAENRQRQRTTEGARAIFVCRLLDHSLEQLIDYLRCALAAVALLACLVGPHINDANLVNAILIWYFIYALVILIIAQIWPAEPLWPLATHAIDIGVSAFLMHFTQGSSSPCFLFFAFALVAATLRWDWRGAIWTTLGLVVLFMVFEAVLDEKQLSYTVLHSIYILVSGLVLAYFGALRARNRQRWAKLAAWPAAEPPVKPNPFVKPNPALEKLLAHAAEVMSAPRILAVWEATQEPRRHFSLWSKGRLECVIEAADEPVEQLVPPNLVDAVFMSHSADASVVWTPGGMKNCKAPAVSPLLRRYNIEKFVSAPFNHAGCRGRVFALDCTRPVEGHLQLLDIVANRIGFELEHYFLQLQIAAVATNQAQAKLAHDLHDGLLQSLTAAALQLKICSEEIEGELSSKLVAIQDLLTAEQRRVRDFVNGAGRGNRLENFSLAEECERVLAELRKFWRCETPLQVVPADARVPSAVAEQVWLILAEAVANAARHGKASRVQVDCERAAMSLTIRINDNGSGFQGVEGIYTDQTLIAEGKGPRFLCDRVRGLGGHLTLSSSPTGSRLQIQLPVAIT